MCVIASSRKAPLSSRSVWSTAEVEKKLPGRFGEGTYCRRFCAGADQTRTGIMALGKTHCAVIVQPGL